MGSRAGCQGGWTSCEQSPSGLTPSLLSSFLESNEMCFFFFFPYWGWLRQQRICLQCGGPEFNSWIRKIWRKEWLPTPILLPGESHGQRSLVGYSPWVCKELDMTKQLIQYQFITFYTFWVYNIIFLRLYTLQCTHDQKFGFHLSS